LLLEIKFLLDRITNLLIKQTHITMNFKNTLALALSMIMFIAVTFGQDKACPQVIDSPHTTLYEPLYQKVLCEYDDNGNCIGSFANTPKLNEKLFYFDTRFRTSGVELIWQTKKAKSNQVFTVLRSRDGQQFEEIGTVDVADYEGTQYSFLDNLPFLGNNFYLLKTNDKKDRPIVSSEQSVYVNLGLVYLETLAIQKEKEKIDFLVTDIDGIEQERKNVALKKGKNNLTILIPFNGIYFVTLTNGFSSVTDIVTQTDGTTMPSTAAITDKIILH